MTATSAKLLIQLRETGNVADCAGVLTFVHSEDEMATEDDEDRETSKARAQAIESLKERVMSDNEKKSKHRMLEQLRERLIHQVILLGENIPDPPVKGDEMRANVSHATALSGYLDAIANLDTIIKSMTARL